MRKTLFISIGLLAAGLWLSQQGDQVASETTQSSSPLPPIVIYTTEWCDFCTSLRTTLKQYQISYHDYDVELSEKGRTDYEKLGSPGVPIIIIGSSILQGYDGQELTDALVDHGYPIPTTWD